MKYNILYRYSNYGTVLLGMEDGDIDVINEKDIEPDLIDTTIKSLDGTNPQKSVFELDTETHRKFDKSKLKEFHKSVIFNGKDYQVIYAYEPTSKVFLLTINMPWDSNKT